jgi:Na+-driven multidrug efflux pump
MGDFLKSLLVALIAFVLFTFPATWLLMLFFGNLGLALSYVATLPIGIIVSILLGGVTSRSW